MPLKHKINCIFVLRMGQVKEFLTEHRIKTLEWPGNSPDLNPIEELWKILGEKSMMSNPTNKNLLNSSLIKVWNHQIKPELLKSLVESMPRRCAAMIKAKGGPTKY